MTEKAAPAAGEKITFSFGENWQDFVATHLNPERERAAEASLKHFLERESLQGLSFLDVGCGSGLFSLAAHRLGASPITSLDVDPRSVASTRHLCQSVGSPETWTILHGSILDRTFTATLPKADLVYAWGSLHHTGSMWQAIRNTCELVAPGGLLFLAIYNKVEGRGSSEFWVKVKKLYNRTPVMGKRLIEAVYITRYHIVPDLIRFRNPLSFFNNYKNFRGMNFTIDVRDWLGGYPYEFASTDEIFRFCTRECGLSLVNLHTVNHLGLNEFLLRRP